MPFKPFKPVTGIGRVICQKGKIWNGRRCVWNVKIEQQPYRPKVAKPAYKAIVRPYIPIRPKITGPVFKAKPFVPVKPKPKFNPALKSLGTMKMIPGTIKVVPGTIK